MTSLTPTIILVAPQMGENIGASARAMLNFGLSDLRLVAPRDGWPSDEAVRNSAGALGADNRVRVQVFKTLGDAISDLHFVLATTARRRDLVKDVYTPTSAATSVQERIAVEQNCGFVFGGERSGLDNDDIALCQGIITIPTNPDFSSLNLGQAVLLQCWEIFRAQESELKTAVQNENTPAPQGQLDELLNRLEKELESADFFKSAGLKPTMLRNIRSMFTRSDLTEQEVRTLHGILSAFTK